MDPRPLVFLLILLACSMFFSASETAFTATPIHKVSSLLRKKKRGSKELYKLKLKPDRMLIAILVGNNVVNIAAASLATVISLNISKMIGYSDGVVITISTIVVTILVLLFGEILPKTFASRHAERVSLLIAPFYIILIKLLYPIILILEAMMKKVKKKSHSEDINQEDLEAFIDISGKAGIFSNNEDQKIKKLIGLQDLTAEEVMTPRVNIKALDDESTLDEAISYIISNKYSRIPIYHEHIDAIDRITTLKELLRFKHHYEGTTLLKNLKLSPIIKVPTSSPVNTLLEQFQKTHKHLALVIDEYGGVDGVVSLEDIIEEIFGEIQDETDEEIIPIQKNLSGNGVICQSYVRLDELLHALNLDFDMLNLDPEYESETLSYLITSHFERFPTIDEKLSFPIFYHDDFDQKRKSKLLLKVLGMKKNGIGEVAVEIVEPSVKKEENKVPVSNT